MTHEDEADPEEQIKRQRVMQRLQPAGGTGGIVGTPQRELGLPPSPDQQNAVPSGLTPTSTQQQQPGITAGGVAEVSAGEGEAGAPGPPPDQQNAVTTRPPPGATPNQMRDWLMGAAKGLDVNDQAAFRTFAQQHGLELGNPNAAGLIDTINVADPSAPGGKRNIDVIKGAAGGRGTLQWGDWGVDAQGRAFGDQVGSGGAGGGGRPTAGTSFQDQLRQRLMQQLDQAGKPISADDPTIAGELQSQERALERNRQDRRAAMAERAAQQGLLSGGASSGAFDADVASGFEDKAAAMSGIRSQLFGRELQGRRQQMAQMLNMALQSGDAEAARALQLQLGQMDVEIRRAGLGEQARQWNDQFGLEGSKFQYGKDRDLALYGGGT